MLAEPDAIAHAEQECLADSEVRERRTERDAQRRAVEDARFVADLAAVVLAQFPGCPRERALRIAGHAGARSSGRIGRTSAGRALDPDAVLLAVIAAVLKPLRRADAVIARLWLPVAAAFPPGSHHAPALCGEWPRLLFSVYVVS